MTTKRKAVEEIDLPAPAPVSDDGGRAASRAADWFSGMTVEYPQRSAYGAKTDMMLEPSNVR